MSSSLTLSSLESSDTQVYEPELRARLGTGGHVRSSGGRGLSRARRDVDPPHRRLKLVRNTVVSCLRKTVVFCLRKALKSCSGAT